jgi:hypothetical protein
MATKKRATHPASDATSWQCIRCDIPLHDPSFGQHAAHIAIGVNFLILTFTSATASLWSPVFSALARLLAYPYTAGGWIVGLLALEGFCCFQKSDHSALCMHLLQLKSGSP